MIRKISFVFCFFSLCASSYAFFILIQKKSEIETQIEMMESLKKEIASTEQETKEMNLEHSNRYSRERAKNQDLESRKLEVDRDLQVATLNLENAKTEVQGLQEDNDVLSKKIEEAKLNLLSLQKELKNTIDKRSEYTISIPLLRQQKVDILSEIDRTSEESKVLQEQLKTYSSISESLKSHYDSIMKALVEDRNARNWLERGEFIKINSMTIDLKNGLLGLPVGKEQGVLEDKLFAIYDKDREICKLRITYSEINKSIATIVPLIGDPSQLLNLNEFSLYHL